LIALLNREIQAYKTVLLAPFGWLKPPGGPQLVRYIVVLTLARAIQRDQCCPEDTQPDKPLPNF